MHHSHCTHTHVINGSQRGIFPHSHCIRITRIMHIIILVNIWFSGLVSRARSGTRPELPQFLRGLLIAGPRTAYFRTGLSMFSWFGGGFLRKSTSRGPVLCRGAFRPVGGLAEPLLAVLGSDYRGFRCPFRPLLPLF